MKKKLLIVALLFSVNNVFADNKSYDVKSGIIEYAIVAEKDASSKDYIKGNSKLYFKNFGATEIVDTTMTQVLFGEEEKERTIVKIDKDNMYTVDFEEETIYSQKLLSDENGINRMLLNKENLLKMGAKSIGTETLLGYKCDVWQLGEDRIWTYNGVSLKQISKSSSGMQLQEAKIANFNIEIKDDKFKLPNFPIKQMDEMIINEEQEGEF